MKTKRSPEQIKAWRAKMGALARDVRAMDPSTREHVHAKCGTVTCEGHVLSPFNTIYLYLQRGGIPCVMIGGFQQWRKAGRVVRAGERAIGHIYVPIGAPKNGNGDAPESEKDNVRFRLVPVVDVG